MMNRFPYVFRAASCINYCRSCKLRSSDKRFDSVRFDPVVAVKEGNENNEGIQALVKVLKSDEIKKFINDKYDGAVIPFED